MISYACPMKAEEPAPNRIKELREAKGWTQTQLASKAKTSQQTVDRLEKGQRQLSIKWMKSFAAALECKEWDLISLHDNVTKFPQTAQRMEPIVPSQHKSPVYGPAAAGEPDRIILTEDYIVEYDPMPPELEGVKNGFRMYVSGSSMEPRHFDGEKISVHPYRKLQPGMDCVIVEEPEGNALVKRFEGETATEWKFSQYNPPKHFSIKKAKVRAIYAVVR